MKMTCSSCRSVFDAEKVFTAQGKCRDCFEGSVNCADCGKPASVTIEWAKEHYEPGTLGKLWPPLCNDCGNARVDAYKQNQKRLKTEELARRKQAAMR